MLASVGLMATDISRADFRQEVGLLGITHKAELSGAVFATLCDQGLVDSTPAETNMEVYKSTLDEALIGLYGSLDNLPAEVAENMDPDVHAESINYFEPMFQFPLSEEAQSRLSANLQTVLTSAQQEIQHYLDSPELADMTADEQSERISRLYSRHAQQIRNLVYAAFRDSVPTEFWEQVGSSLSADFHRDSVRLQELRMLQMQEMRPIHDASE
ncbi:MAG: hypothetical protein JNK74_15915 [Candidatus Hydrogenedentes bacterium]|nr:hypothetical protein [Candidatus Hydrogenedentota bacterium]